MLLRWPTKTYLVDHVHRFVYCPVPKAACTSILRWCLAVAGEDATVSGKLVHGQLRQRRSLHAAGWRVARSVLRDPGYFKFMFVRHPLPRLVSAYGNKVLKAEPLAWPAIRAIQARQDGLYASVVERCRLRWSAARRRDLTDTEAERGVTFRQFVEFVAAEPPPSLEPHWRPQHDFLGGHAFDFIGQFERLEIDFASVQAALGLQLPLTHSNRSSYADAGDGETVADWEAGRLRALPKLPSWRHFYTPELRQIVTRIYAADFEQFGYDPHWTGAKGAHAFAVSSRVAGPATLRVVTPSGPLRRAA